MSRKESSCRTSKQSLLYFKSKNFFLLIQYPTFTTVLRRYEYGAKLFHSRIKETNLNQR